MKTKADGVPKAFEQYKQEEIDLILSMTPTHFNVKNLAKSLGRSPEAIYTIFHMAYSGRWLKTLISTNQPNRQNVITKISKAKKKYGIFIGHSIN